MMRLTLLTLLIGLAGCAAPPAELSALALPTPAPSATPDPYLIALGQAQSQATKQSLDATSMAIEVGMTQTALAPTLRAAETATERAWLQMGWTATAALEQTAAAISGTATAQAWTPTPNYTATIESAAASARATALYGEAVSVELAAERERMMNWLWAVTPWAGMVTALGVFLAIAWRWSKTRPIQRDPRGDAPLLIVDGKVYDADRNPYPVADFSGQKPVIPALTTLELQAAATARDQMIDLVTRGEATPQRRSQAAALMDDAARENALPAPVTVSVVQPEQVKPVMRDVLPPLLLEAAEGDEHDAK
ncbi:MAG: hypothetical protein N2117_12750 [Anaerolineales bacterium]|nr:hypothetical protein [Anaerolineales bacterium]